MKFYFIFAFLSVSSHNAFANGIVLVDEKYNSGIPDNIFQDIKYSIPSGQTLTVDWSNYEFKRRLVTIVPVTVILKVNDLHSYSVNIEQGTTKIVLRKGNLKPETNISQFKGFTSGDRIDISIGFIDVEAKSGNSYFIAVWSATASVD